MNSHNKIHIIFFLTLLLSFFSSCSTKEVTEDIVNENDSENTATVLIDGFYPGDMVTRSSLSYGKEGLKFSWEQNDHFGIFPTAKVTDSGNQQNSTQASQEPFTVSIIKDDGMNAHISSDNSYFHFLSNYRYSAYTPYRAGETKYDHIPFEFGEQTQRGYPDMVEFYKNGNYNNTIYAETEALACQHLGKADILISPETVSDDRPLTFYMRHIGAVSRCFIKTPVGKRLRIREVKLIASDKIFYTRGFIDLTSHPYNSSEVPTNDPPANASQIKNWGVTLPQATPSQITPDETSKTDCLTLLFDDGDTNQKHKGVWNLTNKDDEYGRYLLAYFMMYPINYVSSEASAYIYVIADDVDGNELHYRTTKLASKYMCSGYVYQWTKTPEDIYPIELTATLQSWQEVASGAIDTNLEK